MRRKITSGALQGLDAVVQLLNRNIPFSAVAANQTNQTIVLVRNVHGEAIDLLNREDTVSSILHFCTTNDGIFHRGVEQFYTNLGYRVKQADLQSLASTNMGHIKFRLYIMNGVAFILQIKRAKTFLRPGKEAVFTVVTQAIGAQLLRDDFQCAAILCIQFSFYIATNKVVSVKCFIAIVFQLVAIVQVAQIALVHIHNVGSVFCAQVEGLTINRNRHMYPPYF